MSSWRGPEDRREALAQRLDDRLGVVDRQRRLRDVGELCGIARRQAADAARRLDEMDRAGVARVPLTHRAFDFGMAGVADQHHVAPGLAVARDFHVHLRHQRTGRIEHAKPACVGLAAHGLRNAVCAEDHGGAVRHLVELVDEHRALRAQLVDDEAVVHDFVAHVDRRAERLERALDDLDRAVDAGAETARIGQQHVHDRIIRHRPPLYDRRARTRSAAPRRR